MGIFDRNYDDGNEHVNDMINRLERENHNYRRIIHERTRSEDTEFFLREKHPGLKELYEQYQAMLQLVKEMK